MGSLRGLSRGTSNRLERLFSQGSLTGLPEGQLLERFATARDESAFEALMDRHGPMVLGVCRQFLRDPNDVDDAFQATFLVLVRKAGSLKRKDLLGNWLHGVASRVAWRARSQSARRHSRMVLTGDLETDGGNGCPATSRWGPEAVLNAEERLLLLEEVHNLPKKYATPIVLCYFEGLTHDQAAARLGWPVGTVKGRLARARELLRTRLSRRGVTVSSAALLALASCSDLRAAVPISLAQSTLKAALAVLARSGAALSASSAISLSVASLTEGVIKAMVLAQAKSLMIPVLIATGVLTTGAGVVAFQAGGFTKPRRSQPPVVVLQPAPAPGPVSPNTGQDEVELARKVVEAMEKLSASGELNDPEAFRTWSLRLFELENRTPQPSLTTAEEGHFNRMRHMLEIDAGLNKIGHSTAFNGMRWKFFVNEAERMLIEAKGVGVSGMMGGMGRGGATMQPTPVPSQASPVNPPQPGQPVALEGGGFGGGRDAPDEAQDYILIAGMSAQISTIDKNPQSQAVLKKLDEPISFHFPNETPLEEVLKQIKESARKTGGKPMPIYVDPIGLQEADKTLTSPVIIDLEEVPLRFSLRLLLKQLGMAYCVHDGVLIISSVEGIKRELSEAQAEQMGLNPDKFRGGGFMGSMGGMGGGMRGGSGMM